MKVTYIPRHTVADHRVESVLPASRGVLLYGGEMSHFRTFFGGPDPPGRFLRDVLEDRVDSVPAGEEIIWVTYYFRDEALAAALVRARRRGVSVKGSDRGQATLKNGEQSC